MKFSSTAKKRFLRLSYLIVITLLLSSILVNWNPVPSMAVVNWDSSGEVKNDKSWTVEFSDIVDSSSVTEDTVYIVDSQLNKLRNMSVQTNDNSLIISPGEGQRYQSGDYCLVLTQGLKSSRGSILNEGVQMIFNIPGGKYFTFEDSSLPEAVAAYPYTTNLGESDDNSSWSISSGTLPAGLNLDGSSGLISGTPAQEGTYCFTVSKNNSETRELELRVLKAGFTVEEPARQIAKLCELPVLPKQLQVVYADGSTANMKVFWNPVNLSQVGEKTVRGTLGGTGLAVWLELLVDDSYIEEIEISRAVVLNTTLYSVVLIVSDEICEVYLNGGIEMLLDEDLKEQRGDNREGVDYWSVATTTLQTGSLATFSLYDRYGELVETRAVDIE